MRVGTPVLVVCAFLSGGPALAQTYLIDWQTVHGSGASTGGVYSILGTIGQPAAGGPKSGGRYTLTGGFWSLLSTARAPDASALTIRMTHTNTAVVSWPFPSTGFSLRRATRLDGADWTAPPEAVGEDGTHWFIIVNSPSGSGFYRLVR